MLTIAMPTFDDFSGVWFTIMALRLHHPIGDAEILVVDNNPTGVCGPALEALGKWVPHYRYVPYSEQQGTAIVHEVIFREARGEYVLCVDCHVLLLPGALERLLQYFAQNPQTRDMLTGPLIYDDLKSYSSHMEPRWSTGMYGVWATDPRAADPN